MIKIRGIDVSKWQGTIDWKKVKASGIEFAMIRIGHGDIGKGIIIDPYFKVNIDKAISAGIKPGIYFYSYAKNTLQVVKEADFVITNLKPYKSKIVFPVAFDLEDKSQESLGKKLLTDMVFTFCEKIRKEGYFAALYTNLDWAYNRLEMNRLEEFDLWLAQWAPKPTYNDPPNIWQYTSTGTVDGISGNVDLNIAYKDYPMIDKLIKKNESSKSMISAMNSRINGYTYQIRKYQEAGLYVERIVKDAFDGNDLSKSPFEIGKEILSIINGFK